DLTLDGLRVVLDCANGAAYQVGPTVLEELGAEVFRLGVEPNGRNINDACGSLHPDRTAAKVREVRADVGIALDGDADRCVLVDDRGNVADGDAVLSLCASDLVANGRLRGGAVVATVMSNLGLEKHVEALGLRLVRTSVGDRYVVEAMRSGGFNLGGEQSGHVIFLDHNTTGDGLITALQVLAILKRTGRRLSERLADFVRFPQVLVNVRVAERRPLESLPEMIDLVRKIESELGDEGRVLIRYSGTEPKARIMVEGPDEDRVSEMARELADRLRRSLGGTD
ncbi:partial phosphoglucosamine mutase, partial [Myxococcaceae bacterium]